MVLLNTCIMCNEAIKQPPHAGRRRLYCSDRCRRAANRAKWRSAFMVLAGDEPSESEVEEAARSLPGEILGLPSDPDEAVFACVAEAWTLVSGFARCAERGRPQLQWRCGKASDDLAALLRRYFTAQGLAGSSADAPTVAATSK